MDRRTQIQRRRIGAHAVTGLTVGLILVAPSVAKAATCGTASFGAATNFNVGTNPQSVAIGDFNGDGTLDLAVANGDSNNVSILLGTGTGSFGAATNFNVGTSPVSVAAGDFNGDGTLDLAVANEGSDNVSILLNTCVNSCATPSFGAATNFNVGAAPVSVAVGHFDGGNTLDLAVANGNSNNVSILLGSGTGSFAAATNFNVETFPRSVAVGGLQRRRPARPRRGQRQL